MLNCLFADLYFPSRIFLLFLEPNEVSVDLFSIRPILYQDFVQPLSCPNLLVSMHQAKNTFWLVGRGLTMCDFKNFDHWQRTINICKKTKFKLAVHIQWGISTGNPDLCYLRVVTFKIISSQWLWPIQIMNYPDSTCDRPPGPTTLGQRGRTEDLFCTQKPWNWATKQGWWDRSDTVAGQFRVR